MIGWPYNFGPVAVYHGENHGRAKLFTSWSKQKRGRGRGWGSHNPLQSMHTVNLNIFHKPPSFKSSTLPSITILGVKSLTYKPSGDTGDPNYGTSRLRDFPYRFSI
jgi:hypothetical protein